MHIVRIATALHWQNNNGNWSWSSRNNCPSMAIWMLPSRESRETRCSGWHFHYKWLCSMLLEQLWILSHSTAWSLMACATCYTNDYIFDPLCLHILLSRITSLARSRGRNRKGITPAFAHQRQAGRFWWNPTRDCVNRVITWRNGPKHRLAQAYLHDKGREVVLSLHVMCRFAVLDSNDRSASHKHIFDDNIPRQLESLRWNHAYPRRLCDDMEVSRVFHRILYSWSLWSTEVIPVLWSRNYLVYVVDGNNIQLHGNESWSGNWKYFFCIFVQLLFSHRILGTKLPLGHRGCSSEATCSYDFDFECESLDMVGFKSSLFAVVLSNIQ